MRRKFRCSGVKDLLIEEPFKNLWHTRYDDERSLSLLILSFSFLKIRWHISYFRFIRKQSFFEAICYSSQSLTIYYLINILQNVTFSCWFLDDKFKISVLISSSATCEKSNAFVTSEFANLITLTVFKSFNSITLD